MVLSSQPCSPSPQPPPQPKRRVRHSLNELERRYETALKGRDRAKLASLYAQDTVLIGPRSGVLRGQAAVRLHHDLFRSLPNTSAEGTPRKAEVSGDLGFVEGDYVEKVRGPTGETTERRGNFLRVWKRVNGAWRILYDTYTTEAPNPPPERPKPPMPPPPPG